MRRLLRSVIDFGDGKLTPEALSSNFLRLTSSRIEWVQPVDAKIYQVVKEFFTNTFAIPSIETVTDFFTRSNDVEATERLGDIRSAPVYAHANYGHLLDQIVEDQNRQKMQILLKDVSEIVSKGLETGKGIEKQKLKGVKDGLLYFNQKVHDLIPPDTNARTRGNLRDDTAQGWEDYQRAKFNKDKAWGKFTGLHEIDKTFHGCKRGELWVHAAFAGELKCLAGDVTVLDHETGTRRTLRELHASGDLPVVAALQYEGRESHKLVLAKASHLVENGVREVFDVTLSSGRAIGVTSNHKFFTPRGWCELRSLKEGDFVAVPRKMSVSPRETPLLTDAEVKVLGYLIGDGTFKEEYIAFTATNDAIRQDFLDCLVNMGLREGSADYDTPSFKVQFSPDRAPSVRISHSTGAGNSTMVSPVRTLLEALGLWGLGASDKRIPPECFGLCEDQVALLLGSLWSTDGSCHSKDRSSLSRRNDITYASKSKHLCLDIQSLLLRLGIRSTVTSVNTSYKNEPYVFHVVRVVGNDSKRLFARLVRVVGKENRFARLAERLPSTESRTIPSDFIPEGRKVRVAGGYDRHSNGVKLRPTVTVDEACRFVTPHDLPLKEAISGDLDWEPITSIRSRGLEMTYDLSVPAHHSFVANDIVTHNTTFATNWCYNLVTRYRTNVMYVSMEMPYEQIRRLIYVIHSGNVKWALKGHKPLDYTKVRDGELTVEEEAFYQEVLHDFENNPEHCRFEVWAPDKDVTIDDVRVEAELLHKEMDVGLVVLDHGGLMKARRAHKDYTIELNSILRDSKKFALHFNGGEGVPTLMLFQLNRQGKDAADKAAGRYKLSALSYANEAERSADYVTTTYLNDEHRANGTTMFCCLKSRDNAFFDPFLATVDFRCRRLFNYDESFSSGSGISSETPESILDTMYTLAG